MKKVFQVLAVIISLIIVVPAMIKGMLTVPYPMKLAPIAVAIQIAAVLWVFYTLSQQAKKIDGPYSPGQKSESCGHYYPDVIRLGDQIEGDRHTRILDCIFCGQYKIYLGPDVETDIVMSQLPTDEWREKTRQSLRKMSPE